MNVLSLFDGMSCGQIALNRAGIKYDKYYASEIDKHAIKVTQHNHPNTIQVGDVTQLETYLLPEIDLLIGGSPCQGFSFAGKQLNFNDDRSKLFFEFVRILKEVRVKNPDVLFMLENVKMKKEFQNVISLYLGVQPIEINSALVSAQNRNRLYWTNIPTITIKEDKGLMIRDILDGEILFDKEYKCGSIRGRRIDEYGKRQDDNKYIDIRQFIEERADGKSNCITTVEKDNIAICKHIGQKLIKKLFNTNPSGSGMNGWVYHTDYKSPTLTTNKGEGGKISSDGYWFRKLTPVECERLQTVPDNYTDSASNSQRYKMLGNGWTVDVIVWIFNHMKPTNP